MNYNQILQRIREKTNTVILFHSGTGKDSIMLCDLCSKTFDKAYCVFMYLVKDLEYELKYIQWAEKRYQNIEFIKVPHYALSSFIRNGYLGIEKSEKYPKQSIKDIDKHIRKKLNIQYSVYGFKKIDGITRRLMLNDTDNGINTKTGKVYPLMDLKNGDVLNYIEENQLIYPFSYGTKKPSSGCDISTPEFQEYLQKYYPNDLQKIYKQFPMAPTVLFKHLEYGKSQP